MRGPVSWALGFVPVQAQEGECSRVGSLWGKGPARERRTSRVATRERRFFAYGAGEPVRTVVSRLALVWLVARYRP